MSSRTLCLCLKTFGCLLLLSFSLFAQTEPPAAPPKRPALKAPAEPQLAKPAEQPEDAGTIKLETALVNVPVLVMDHNGKYLPHLTRQDFQIFEDNIAQEIDAFAPVEAPFNVVLLLDTSGSTRFKLEDIQRAALAFVEALRAQDRVMVVSFDTRIYIDCEFTGDRRKLREAILRTRTGQVTRVYDAIDLVMTERLNKMTGRKAIVLFSDGVDTASQLATALGNLEMLEEADVLVYPIWYDTQPEMQGGTALVLNGKPVPLPPGFRVRTDPVAYERGAKYMRELADRTGAQHYQAASIPDLHKAFAQIADELRFQYALSYYPSNTALDGSYRRLRVRVNVPEAVVRTRKGYRAASKP